MFITLVVSFGALMNITVAASLDELQTPCNVLFPKSLTEYQMRDIEQQFSDIVRVDESYKPEVNSTYKVTILSGESFFYKAFTEYFLAECEAAASIIANYISNGLIPKGRLVKNGIVYPYVNIDSEKTEEVFGDKFSSYDHKSIYEKLTSEQRVELFISMLCGMVLLNTNAQSGQFGITSDGHLTFFGKGYTYSSIFADKNITKFSGPDNFISSSTIYKDFFQELKNHPEELRSLLKDPRVREAFLRINALIILPTERKYVEQTLAPLFAIIKQRINDNDLKEHFSDDYFQRLKDITGFFVKEEIPVEDVNGVKVVKFDPKVNKMHLIAAKEHGFLEGEQVTVIAEKAHALVAINGGFFTSTSHWIKRGVNKKFGCILRTDAFPSAIQKVNNVLLSDTSNYLPALGISDSGDIKIGEVKVVWSATPFENGKKVILDRVANSSIDPYTTDATIYYRDSLEDIKEIGISNGKVSRVKTVAQTAEGTPNCYWLRNPLDETISEFDSLKVGDYLDYGYALEAAAYPEQAGIIDSELTSFFNNCPYVVSAGQLLIKDGEVDPRIAKDYGRETHGKVQPYTNFGTAVCVRKDGMARLIVKKGDLPSNEFVGHLKEENCEYAVSLDGGGSTTLVANENVDKPYGHNIVVSDIVAIMPSYSNVLLSQYL